MTSLRKILIFGILGIQLGCNNKSDKKKPDPSTATQNCHPYFAYDEVKYYYIDIDENSVTKLQDSKKSDSEIKKWELLTQQTPSKISDSMILENIDMTGYSGQVIPKNKFQQLDQIFCERKHENSYATTCIAIYRDILVFKRNNKIVGIAKICFDCGQSIITGTDQNTEDFGQSGDFRKLSDLLHRRTAFNSLN